MAVRKEPSGRWRAVIKSGRQYVAGRTFDTKSAAVAWETRQRAALDGVPDLRAGRVALVDAMDEWHSWRRGRVAESTWKRDQSVIAGLPRAMGSRELRSIRTRDIEHAITEDRVTVSTMKRRLTTLGAFFSWCVREGMLPASPVKGVEVPRGTDVVVAMNPWTWQELEHVAADMGQHAPRMADVVLVLGWTGLRWGEARALRVGDVMREQGSAALMVRSSHSEGMREKSTKGGRSRRVPVADRVLPIIERWVRDKSPSDLLLTTERGAQVHKSNLRRAVRWHDYAPGHSIHDLRHTAATEWLRSGVDVRTVQAWLGHSSLTTTQVYVHYLGSSADRTALDLINERGTLGAHDSGSA